MTKLKTIYKELGIKYDLREARKYLKVDKKLCLSFFARSFKISISKPVFSGS
jgi:hypothetical protein